MTLILAAFSAQIEGWNHWITIGITYGAGVVLMLLSTVWITKSYYSREPRPKLERGDEEASERVRVLASELNAERSALEEAEQQRDQALFDLEEVRRANNLRSTSKSGWLEAAQGADAEGEKYRELERARTKIAMLSDLQWEALELAHDLREFHASLAPFPDDPQQEPEEDTAVYLTRFHQFRATEWGKWHGKLLHGYANRGFGKRITSFMHRLGEQLDYPAYVPDFAERITATKDTLPKLAQQMEMVMIWINRKQRNEVDLLHEKP